MLLCQRITISSEMVPKLPIIQGSCSLSSTHVKVRTTMLVPVHRLAHTAIMNMTNASPSLDLRE